VSSAAVLPLVVRRYVFHNIFVLTGLFALLALRTVRYTKHFTFPDPSASLVGCVFELQVL